MVIQGNPEQNKDSHPYEGYARVTIFLCQPKPANRWI
jgi:hypothetical protein